MPHRKPTLAAMILIGTISGQAVAATQTTTHHTMIKTTRTETPVSEGANSFTEAQARHRLIKAGYSNVSRLAKDDAGVWRGTAMKHRHRVHVGLDFKGDITTN